MLTIFFCVFLPPEINCDNVFLLKSEVAYMVQC